MGGSGQQAGGGARASELRECVRAACEGAGGRRGRPVGGCRRAAGWLRRGGRSVPERDGACLPGAVETDRECHPDAVCVLCRRRAPRRTERPGTQDCEHLKSGWWWTSADFARQAPGSARSRVRCLRGCAALVCSAASPRGDGGRLALGASVRHGMESCRRSACGMAWSLEDVPAPGWLPQAGRLCGAHRVRAAAAPHRRSHAHAREDTDGNSWQSRPRCAHASHDSPTKPYFLPRGASAARKVGHGCGGASAGPDSRRKSSDHPAWHGRASPGCADRRTSPSGRGHPAAHGRT